MLEHLGHGLAVGAVDLVDDDDVCEPEVGLTRVVRQLVARAQRIRHDDVQVRAHEREVVVPAVPDEHVALALSKLEDSGVVDPGEDGHTHRDRILVLLPLLEGGMRGVDLLEGREALDAHRRRGLRTASDDGRAPRAGRRR